MSMFDKAFAPLKKHLPSWVSTPLRNVVTAVATPAYFGLTSGHFRSSFQMAAVTADGKPLPWYTYPCIDFLAHRDFQGLSVLEFGGGQSSLWWSQRAKQVVTLEENLDWYNKIKASMPSNVSLHHVPFHSAETCIAGVEKALEALPHEAFDVIIIDGMYRAELVPTSLRLLADTGILICDNAEGYGFKEALEDSGLNRVDFLGHTPGVLKRHTTSIYFSPQSFAFQPSIDIPLHI